MNLIQRAGILLSVIISISPFILLAVFYTDIPEQVPAFVDLKGNPVLMMEKNVFSIIRLPLMGVLVQIICFVMYTIRLEYDREKNQFLWLCVSLLAALKMSLTSMEVLLYTNSSMLHIIRTIVWVIVLAAVLSIAVHAYALYKRYQNQPVHYISNIHGLHKALLIVSFTGYVLLALFPLIH